MSPIEQGEALLEMRDRLWVEVHVEGMLGFEDAYHEGRISPGQFISGIRAHLRKLRRAYPEMDD